MAKSTYQLEAIIDLENHLKLGSEFLGHSERASIGGVDVEVFLPDFEKEGDSFRVVSPVTTKINWLGNKPQVARFENPWGVVLGWHKDKGREGINSFGVDRLLVKSIGKVSEAQAQKLLHSARDWAKSLDAWVETMTGVDLATPSATVEQHSEDVEVWLDAPDKNKQWVHCGHPVIVKTNFQDNLNISHSSWKTLLSKASNSEIPPESHQFLRDARQMFNERRYRRSVLDAATATEIALTELQSKSLPMMSADRRKDIKRKFRQIDGLTDSLTLMGIAYPINIIGKVGEPRNDAIHKGKEPDQAVAQECLAKATEVVELVIPKGSL